MSETGEILKRFHHVGLAVNDASKALEFYQNILGGKLSIYKEIGTTKDYTFTQLVLGGQTIEFIEPIPGRASFLTKFLAERGEGLHHITFQVSDIRKAIAHLRASGVRIVDEFLEGDPLWQTAFISPKSSNGVLIQLYQTVPGSPYDH